MSDCAGPDAAVPRTTLAARETYRADTLLTLLHLRWFIRLRWVMIAATLVVLLVERLAVTESVRPNGLLIALGVLAIVNALWTGVSHALQNGVDASGAGESHVVRIAREFANAQVACDLLALTVILHYTGGVESPMALFYLLHMALGPLFLEAWQAILQGVWAVVLYAALALGEWSGWIAPHYAFLPWLGTVGLADSLGYALASIGIVSCGIFATLALTLRIVARLEERDRRLRQARAALEQSLITIRELQRRRARFMRTAAHQLKSPLAVVQTMVGLIRDELVPQDRLRKHCQEIVKRCREGIDQVGELLALARLQESDPGRHRAHVADVGEVVQDVCRHFSPLAEEAGLTLRCELATDQDLRARIDPADLAICVTNLVDNAIKYTSGPGNVSVSVDRGRMAAADASPAEFVTVAVEDTGMGIDPEDFSDDDGPNAAGSVFEAFRRGNRALAAAIPGTGLGLSIVREVMEQSGGRIRVRSQPGRGSVFTIAFPCIEPVAGGCERPAAYPGEAAFECPNGIGCTAGRVIGEGEFDAG